MRHFCDLFVREVFVGIFRQDVAALRGKPLNLLRDVRQSLPRMNKGTNGQPRAIRRIRRSRRKNQFSLGLIRTLKSLIFLSISIHESRNLMFETINTALFKDPSHPARWGAMPHIVTLRVTEGYALFQTDGELNKARVAAGIASADPMTRITLFKRKQTTPERLTGREMLRNYGLISTSEDEKNPESCIYNVKSCRKCPDCITYGFAIGDGGSEKSKVYSILPSLTITPAVTKSLRSMRPTKMATCRIGAMCLADQPAGSCQAANDLSGGDHDPRSDLAAVCLCAVQYPADYPLRRRRRLAADDAESRGGDRAEQRRYFQQPAIYATFVRYAAPDCQRSGYHQRGTGGCRSNRPGAAG